MTHRLRQVALLILVATAVVVPLRAFADGGLNVSASLNQCGVSGASVVCEITTNFNSVDGAKYYTASVTLPDGTVAGQGEVSPGTNSMWFSYVGAGTYRVQITAWGYDEDGRPEVLDEDGSADQVGEQTDKPSQPTTTSPTGPRPDFGEDDTDDGNPITDPDEGAATTDDSPPDPAPDVEPEPEPAVTLPPCETAAAPPPESAGSATPVAPRACATAAQSPTGPCCP